MLPEDLERIRAWKEDFPEILQPAHLWSVFFDSATDLTNAILGDEKFGFVSVANVHWGEANLSSVRWQQVQMLGDERVARDHRFSTGELKSKAKQLEDFEAAVRANRQLAIALRGQGMNVDADRFSYRAQVCERQVLRRQGHYGRALGSWFLDLISGYGYKPIRSVITYLLVIFSFAAAYYLLGNNVSPALDVHGAIVFSLTSFHGRGFAPGGSLSPDNLLTTLAAFDAVIGLLIEITFIATFTQRFFAR
jgi:hypothetical protein